MADYKAKKAALQDKLKRLEEKRAQYEASIAECDRMMSGEAPKAAKSSGRKRG